MNHCPNDWQRAECSGPSGQVKRPKLQSDEAKMTELFVHCRNANFREARAVIVHFPYLLALTDRHGFSALHHAEMSGNAGFVEKLLALYHDPRAFTNKQVRYESAEALRADCLSCCLARDPSQVSSSRGAPSVRRYSSALMVLSSVPASNAANSGVMSGDTLRAINGEAVERRVRSFTSDGDWTELIIEGALGGRGFPMTLEFRGPACNEILGRDGWTPLHAAAGGGEFYKHVYDTLIADQEDTDVCPGAAYWAQDSRACTPEHWSLIAKHSSGYRRRPLSAGVHGAPVVHKSTDPATAIPASGRAGSPPGSPSSPSHAVEAPRPASRPGSRPASRPASAARPSSAVARPGSAVTRPGSAVTRPGSAKTRPSSALTRRSFDDNRSDDGSLFSRLSETENPRNPQPPATRAPPAPDLVELGVRGQGPPDRAPPRSGLVVLEAWTPTPVTL